MMSSFFFFLFFFFLFSIFTLLLICTLFSLSFSSQNPAKQARVDPMAAASAQQWVCSPLFHDCLLFCLFSSFVQGYQPYGQQAAWGGYGYEQQQQWQQPAAAQWQQ